MRRKLRFGVLAAGALVAGSLGAGLASTATASSPSPQSADEGMTIAVVTHGQASDPFWSVFKRGVDDAAAQMGVTVNYSAPATFDMVADGQLIDAAVAKNPDGLVVSVPDYDALQGLARRGHRGRHPDHHGQLRFRRTTRRSARSPTSARTRRSPAEGAGARLADAGATHVMCINQEVGNAGLDARCAGAKEAIEEAGGTLDVRPGRPQRRRPGAEHDQRDAAGRRHDRRRPGPRPDRRGAGAGRRSTSSARPARSCIGTFDLSPDVIQAIIDGNMLFAVDQQQYLQGYLPIVFLTLYHDNLNTVGGGQPVLTGPGFVTPTTPQQVLELTGAGFPLTHVHAPTRRTAPARPARIARAADA